MESSKTNSNTHFDKHSDNSDDPFMQYAEVLYKCSLCSDNMALFFSKKHFKIHMEFEHLQQSNNLCNCANCNLKFKTKKDLISHFERFHPDKPYSLLSLKDTHRDNEHSSSTHDCIQDEDRAFLNVQSLNNCSSGVNVKVEPDWSMEEYGQSQDLSSCGGKKSKDLINEELPISTTSTDTNGLKVRLQFDKIRKNSYNSAENCLMLDHQYHAVSETRDYAEKMKENILTGKCFSLKHASNLIQAVKSEVTDTSTTDSTTNELNNTPEDEQILVYNYVNRGLVMDMEHEVNKDHMEHSMSEALSHIKQENTMLEHDNDIDDVQRGVKDISHCMPRNPFDLGEKDSTFDSYSSKTESLNITEHTKQRADTVKVKNVPIVQIENLEESTQTEEVKSVAEIIKKSRSGNDKVKRSEPSMSDPSFVMFPKVPKLSTREKLERKAVKKNISYKESDSEDCDSTSSDVTSESTDYLSDSGDEGKEKIPVNDQGPVFCYYFTCFKCDSCFKDIAQYRQHIQRRHSKFTKVAEVNARTTILSFETIKKLLKDLLCVHQTGEVSLTEIRKSLVTKLNLKLKAEPLGLKTACNLAITEMFPASTAVWQDTKCLYYGIEFKHKIQKAKTQFKNVTKNMPIQEGPGALEYEIADDRIRLGILNRFIQSKRELPYHLILETFTRFMRKFWFWTGNLTRGVSRTDFLDIVSYRMNEESIKDWTSQCDEAVQKLFPFVEVKTTKLGRVSYYGLDYKPVQNLKRKESE